MQKCDKNFLVLLFSDAKKSECQIWNNTRYWTGLFADINGGQGWGGMIAYAYRCRSVIDTTYLDIMMQMHNCVQVVLELMTTTEPNVPVLKWGIC